MSTEERPADEDISLPMIRMSLCSAVICDALDTLGYPHQAIPVTLRSQTGIHRLVGRCKTMLWADADRGTANPYELELKAVDGCKPDSVVIAAAGGSMKSGIWGELLSTAASNRGSVGAIVDGAVRDVGPMTAMGFPVFARGVCPYDSKDRQSVVDIDIPVKIGGLILRPGDLVFADQDGIVVIPAEIEKEAVHRAWAKVHAENVTRQAIRDGMKITDAYEKYGVL